MPGTFHEVSLPLRDINNWSPLTAGIPTPATFRPRRFTHPRRFTPPLVVAGLFHPTATSGIRSSGSFLAAKPACLIDKSFPHAVSPASPRDKLPRRCQLHSLRLQGINPSSDPLRPTGGLVLLTARSPPEFSAPAGLASTTLETPSRPFRS